MLFSFASQVAECALSSSFLYKIVGRVNEECQAQQLIEYAYILFPSPVTSSGVSMQ